MRWLRGAIDFLAQHQTYAALNGKFLIVDSNCLDFAVCFSQFLRPPRRGPRRLGRVGGWRFEAAARLRGPRRGGRKNYQ